MKVESASPAVVLDVDGALARFGGDRGLFLELTSMLLEDAPQLFAELKVAVQRKDDGLVEGKAHALKGLLLNCGGTRSARVAQQLEDAGHNRHLERRAELIDSLESELGQLTSAIHAYRG